MPAPRTAHGERRAVRVLRLVERLLLVGGAAMLACYAYFALDARLTQRDARQLLASAAANAAAAPAAAGQPDLGPVAASTAIPIASRGTAVGELIIPRIHLSAVVLHGTDERTLRRGPGHLETTPLPGQPGNAVIAGHRDSFFRPLRHVKSGDDVFVQTPAGRLHYRVVSLQVVDARDVSVLEPTRERTLTLITCYPFWVFGSAPDRFIVRATQVSSHTGDPLPRPTVEWSAAQVAPPVPSPGTPRPPPIDDETVVRHAIERFRRAYNARVTGRRDATPGSLLAFDRCDIAWLGDDAIATCGTPPPAAGDSAREPWLVTLARVDDGWAIRSVQSP